MFSNMYWYGKKDPTILDYNMKESLRIDVLFNKAPEVRTLNTLDIHHFD